MRVRLAGKRGRASRLCYCHQHLFPTVDSRHQVGPLGQGHEDQVFRGDLSLLPANQGNVGGYFRALGRCSHGGGFSVVLKTRNKIQYCSAAEGPRDPSLRGWLFECIGFLSLMSGNQPGEEKSGKWNTSSVSKPGGGSQ